MFFSTKLQFSIYLEQVFPKSIPPVVYARSDLLSETESKKVSVTGTNVNISVYLSIYLSICLSIYLSVYPSIHLSIYPSIYVSIYLAIYLTNYLSFYLSTYISQEGISRICIVISLEDLYE